MVVATAGAQGGRWSILGGIKLNREQQNGRKSSFLGAAAAVVDDEKNELVADEEEFLKSCEVGCDGVHMELVSKKKGGNRVILDQVKGKAFPGRMLAVMGPSGSGKTTFLSALAGRVKADKKIKLEGLRYINNDPILEDSRIPAAFVEQEANFFPHMTVKETLDFRVKLKLGSMIGAAARDDMVADLMDALSLTKVSNTIVGNVKVRGVSGGERKRLSIACEMISSPSIIFLDEPTSGLDSFQAEQVVSTLRKLADSGKTIIAVIHQPSQKVFGMFDDLLLLSEGRQMYFGEVKKARAYFESIGYSVAKETGTAEHVIDCVSRITNGNAPDMEQLSLDRLNNIAAHAQTQAKAISFDTEGSTGATKHKTLILSKTVQSRNVPSANIFQQFQVLMTRSLRELFRGKGAIIIKVVQQVTLALVYGGIYHVGSDQASIMDRFGLLSLIAIGGANMSIAGTIRSFPKEKAIIGAEIGSNMYSTVPYFIAKAISEIPLLSIYSAIFSAIIYPLSGLQKGKFFNFMGLTSLSTLAAESIGLLVGSVSANSDVALALLPPILVLSIIFDGRNISIESIPKGLRWIQNVGPIRWAFESLCINEFSGLNFDVSGPRRGPPVKTGTEALARFGFVETALPIAVTAQLKIIGACWLISILGLSLTKQKFQVMKPPALDA